ncbi:Gldg family protein [Gammaproteobacteria bacterium]|nr:Gldg family protein [Gammaproteobacteria bacterium]
MNLKMSLNIILLVLGFLLFAMINNIFIGSARFDLSENGLYSLSDGTKEVIDEIDEPINLYFFFSQKISSDMPALRTYSQRVYELLEEYELIAGGKIKLSYIDPEPFSEQEDRAAEFGLQSVPINQAGDELYFGLAGTNSLDGREVIPFFQPDKEEFLEYEISKLVHNLAKPEKATIGVYSDLPVQSTVDPRTFQPTSAWVFIQQLEELFEVQMIKDLEKDELSDLDLLLIVHPKNLSESALFSVDQYVLSGGKLLAFVDPLAELDQPGPGTPGVPSKSSDLNAITKKWGVVLREQKILGDPEVALLVGGADGRPVRHLGILGFSREYLGQDNVVTSSIETVNMATAGIFDLDTSLETEIETLIRSSESSGLMDAYQFEFLSNPEDLQKGFSSTGESFVVAARISGAATSNFEGAIADREEFIPSSESIQVMLIADTDILADRLWVQVQSFFGQQIATAFADNGTLIANAVENLSGSSSLISVRSRGQFSRPFEVVDRLRRNAEVSYLQSAERLQLELADTERKLAELESSSPEDGLIRLSDEQTEAIKSFQDEKLRIRKQLRDVRHRLDKDIEDLGGWLKLINILVMPLLLTGLLLIIRVVRYQEKAS